MTVHPVTIDEEWHERLKARLMEKVRLRRRAELAEERMPTDPTAARVARLQDHVAWLLAGTPTLGDQEVAADINAVLTARAAAEQRATAAGGAGAGGADVGHLSGGGAESAAPAGRVLRQRAVPRGG